MKKIVLLYWGKGGNVENTAKKVYDMFNPEIIDMFDIVSFDASTLNSYKLMIIGHSTVGTDNWDDATANNEWNRFYRKLDGIGQINILATSFGLGNHILYPDHFVDNLGHYKNEMDKLNIKTIGKWSSVGYKFTNSDGEINGFFYGLALDVDNEPKQSEERIKNWTEEIKKEMKF